jgi:hypothetical protein
LTSAAPVAPLALPVVPAAPVAPVVPPLPRSPYAPPLRSPYAPPSYADELPEADAAEADAAELDGPDDDERYDDIAANSGAVAARRPKVSVADRIKHTPPALVILTLAAIGSTGFLGFELSTRTAPIAVLSSASVVTGLCYVIVAGVCAFFTYRAGSEGLTRRAFVLAFIGGMAAIIAAMSFAGALVLVLALGF